MALSLFRSSSAGVFGSPNALRDFAIPALLFPIALYAPSEWLIYVFVVAGQGHFLMTYLYQYKGGKMDRAYLLSAFALLVGAGLYLYYLGDQGLWVFLLVSLLFPAHYALDEFVLHGEAKTPYGLATVAAFTLLAFLSTLTLAYPESAGAFRVALIAFAAWALVRLARRSTLARTEEYLLFVGAVVALLTLLGRPEQTLSAIIILHGFNWLVGYGKRVEADPKKRREFWKLAAITHGLGLVGFAAFHALKVEALRYFFVLLYYDFWAVAHIALTWGRRGGRPKAA